MKKLLFVLLLFPALFSFSQTETHVFTTYDTLINAGYGGITWRLRISRPTNMFANHPDSASRPAIIFIPGQGEMGTSYSGLGVYGPHYWQANGWDGGVTLSNGKHFPILITMISSNTFMSGREANDLLTKVLNIYHIKRNSVHVGGLSQGAFALSSMIWYEATPGDETGMKLPTSLTCLQGRSSDPLNLGNNNNKWAGGPDAWAYWAQKYKGKFFGLEGFPNDMVREVWRISEPMNAAVPGSAYYAYENIGGGGHCCWNSMVDPSHTNWRSIAPVGPNVVFDLGHPGAMGTYNVGDNVFTWMLRQGDTSLVGAAAVLSANAGGDKNITLPTSSVSLTGSGTPASGTSITGYAWTKISGPNTPTESAPNAANNNLTGLVAGTYVYRLTVTTNITTTATDDINIVVNPAANIPPVVSAGATQIITLPIALVTMGGTASDPDGTITSTSWSRVSGPNTPLITLPASLTSTITGLIAGTYVFRLSATDNNSATSTADVTITVNPLLNIPPIVSAGATQTITLPVSSVTMAGTASDPDGTIASTVWSRVSGPNTPTITTPGSLTSTITGLIAGTYVFRLTATDNVAATTTADITIVVNPGGNTPPVVNAGATQTITLPISSVTMAGTASDPDGTIASTTWSRVSGPNTPTITTPGSLTSTITGLIAGTYVFRLSATDNSAATSTADVTINVNPAGNVAPVVSAGATQTITLPISTVTMAGTASDPDGTIASTTWSRVSGPNTPTITTPGSLTSTITGLIAGTYVFRLSATDNGAATSTADVTIIVNPAANVPPVVNAGTTQTITLPISTVTVTGTASDPDGTIASTTWSRVSGPNTPTITTPAGLTTTITGLIAGTYVFRLSATDNGTATTTANVTIIVNPAANVPPIVNAGTTQTITLPLSTVTMAGSASDPDGTIATTIWTRVSGPNTPTITTPGSYNTTIIGLIAGTYVFRLSVTDNGAAASTADVTVIVNPAANVAPVVSAGTTQAITLPVSTVTMAGSASDPDGTITAAGWTRVSGPNTPTITAPASYTTTITGLVAGTYVFRLSATDNNAATTSADVTIIVNNPVGVPGTKYVWNASNADIIVDNIVFGKKLKAGDTIIIPARAGGYASQTYQGVNSGAAGAYVVVQFDPGAYLSPLTNDNLKSYLDSCSGLKITGMKMYDRGAVPFRLGNNAFGPDRGIPRGYSSWIWIDSAQIIASSSFENSYTGIYPDYAGDTTKMFHHWKWTNCIFDSSYEQGIYTSQIAINLGRVSTYGYWRDVEIANCVFDHYYSVASPSVYVKASNSYNVSVHNNTFRNLGMVANPIGHAACVNYGAARIDIFDNVFGPNNFANDIRGSNADLPIPGYMGRNKIYNNITFNKRKYPFCDATFLSPLEVSTLMPYIRQRTSPEIYNITAYNMALGVGHTPYISVILDCYVDDTATVKNCIYTQVRDAPWATSSPRMISKSNATNSITVVDTSNNRLSEFWVNSGIADSVTFTPSLGGMLYDKGVIPPSYNTKDVWGYNRTAGASTDIGAVEYRVGGNQPPIAAAGTDQFITVPTSQVTLNGSSSSDFDGTIVSYVWTKSSGGPATITTSNAAVTTVTGLTAGTYIFQLTVTDNLGATGTDYITVTVNTSASNAVPIAIAGSNQTITLPANSVTLTGSGTDADGSITGYSWTKLSGPAATINSATSATTTVTGLVTGVYQFQLTVTDNSGATGTDIVMVTVNTAANQAPVADAGSNMNITLPTNTVTFNGSGTDADGSVVAYSWTKLSGPAATITNATSATTSVTGLVAGIYQFQLTVTDNNAATGSDIVTVTVNASANQAPIAVAGTNQAITLPTNSASLNGSGTDADGTITTYSWTKLSGPAATITTAGSAATTVTGLVAGVYQFQLTVTDNNGATATDIITITVNPAANQAPIAVAGVNQVITLPTNSVSLSGSGVDPDGTITAYSWTKLSGPAATITTSGSATTTVTGLVAGTYQFELTVTDNGGATATDFITVIVNAAAPTNQAPIADAGSNINITLPTNSVTLSGSGIDPDGTISGYSWTKVSGPAASFGSPTSASTTVTGLSAGTYQFLLTVTDNNGATGTDIVTITVNGAANQAPIADAGSNISITLPTSSVTLTGSGVDFDGTITDYSWTKVSGPSASIGSPTSASTNVTGLTAGTYQFMLTVTDDNGATGTDIVTVTVNGAANQAPIADAGSNINITLPANSVTLNGSGVDFDGTITGYSWTKISGPSATISSASSASTTVTGLVAGVYQFELEVTDDGGITAVDVVTVTVSAASNQLPIAYAGINQNITLPVNYVTLSGSGTDPDGSIVSYSWTKLSGPAAGNIVSPSSASSSVTGLVMGVYVFQLDVTDNEGAIGTDIITVTVSGAANTSPIAYAGADRTITLPVSNVILDGSGSFDPDGTIVSYSWIKISGPSPTTVVNATSDRATIPTVYEGTYEFELTVVDNSGAVSKDRVVITVLPVGSVVNLKPIANAGNDATISIPAVTSVLLDGSKSSDPDGTIVGYAWRQLAGPSAAVILSPASASTTVNNLNIEGDYFFELTVTDNKGETAKDTVRIGSVNTLRVTQSITLFPNPASDIMKLRFISDKTGKMTMRIYDVLGRFVMASDLEKSATMYEKSVDVSHLAPGSYFLRLEFSDGNHAVQKFIKL